MKSVVFLHGFGTSASIWADFIALLPQENQYFAADYSAITFCQTVEEYADWLHLELKERNISDFYLIGHSMGGYIALAYTEKYGKNVAGLGLFHSTSYADSEEKKAARLKTIGFIEKHGAEEFLSDFLPNMFSGTFKKSHSEVVNQIIEKNKNIPAEALISATLAMRQRPDRRHILQNFEKPILMLIGKQDNFIPYQNALEQVALIQKPLIYIHHGVAHAGMIEAPEVFAKVVKSMLDN